MLEKKDVQISFIALKFIVRNTAWNYLNFSFTSLVKLI